jgi:hypothetical protein
MSEGLELRDATSEFRRSRAGSPWSRASRNSLGVRSDRRFGILATGSSRTYGLGIERADMSLMDPEDQKFGRNAAEEPELVDTLDEQGVAAEDLPEEPARNNSRPGHKAEKS